MVEDLMSQDRDTFLPCPFITKDIAGYFLDKYNSEGVHTTTTIRIYLTASGTYVSSFEIPEPDASLIKKKDVIDVIAKGRILCYQIKSTMHVLSVVGKEVKKYDFPFPYDHFIKTGQLRPLSHSHEASIDLLGFAAKSNVLIGNLRRKKQVLLFGLNLDAAFGARNEEEVSQAFSMSPIFNSLGSPENDFKPIYKTDRASRRVELIGVMREKNTSSDGLEDYIVKKMFDMLEEEKALVENGLFVTIMECPTTVAEFETQ